MVAVRKPSNQQKHDEEQLDLAAAEHTISALVPVTAKGEAVQIYFDGVPWRITPRAVIKEMGLQVGASYQTELLRESVCETERRFAMDMAFRMISYRARSRQELQERLTRKRFSAESIEWVLEKLLNSGYLNDTTFIRMWIRDRMELKGYGRYRIRSELLAKGVDTETVNRELDSIYPAADEKATATELLTARISHYSGLEESVQRRRLRQFLLRRGYSGTTAQKAVSDLMSSMRN